MTIGERRAAIRAFNAGAAGILLATDAGSEGLNLQSRCRLVVNLELPWNPMRLEQRIGRVDRIGQTRTVHAVHLFAHDTAEATVLAHLHRRIDAIRASEIEIAACVIDGRDLTPVAASPAPIDTWTISEDFRHEAEKEADRLASLNRLARSATGVSDPSSTAVTFVRTSSACTSSEMVWLFRAHVISAHGRLIEELLIPINVQLFASPSKASAATLIERLRPFVLPVVKEHVAARATHIARNSSEWIARAISRERQIFAALGAGDLFQASLFKRESLREHEEPRTRAEHLRDEIDVRVRRYELDAATVPHEDPILLLVLIRC
jgi:hypothetical protein